MLPRCLLAIVLVPTFFWFNPMAYGRQPAPILPEAWSAVEDALNKDQPETAARLLEPIAEQARRQGDPASALKAEWMLESIRQLKADDPLGGVTRWLLERVDAPEIRGAAEEPLVDAVAAEALWRYYQANRYAIADRTPTASDSGSETNDEPIDLATADAPRLLDAIDASFQRALSDSDPLKSQPTANWKPLLDLGSHDARYTPTLFDFVSRRALDFYESGDRAPIVSPASVRLTSPEQGFVAAETFCDQQLRFEAADRDHPDVRAWQVLQGWLCHRMTEPENLDALIWADLRRLEHAAAKSPGKEASERHRSAVRALIKRHQADPASAWASATLAELHRQDDDLKLAHAVASTGFKRHPESEGGKQCAAIIGELERKELSVHADRVLPATEARLQIRFRNLRRVYFRLVRRNAERALQANEGSIDDEYGRPAKIPAARIIKSWSVKLDAETDLHSHTQMHLFAPEVPLGSYWLQSSVNETFTPADNQLSAIPVWRSDLSLMVRLPAVGTDTKNERNVEALVTDNRSGRPISNADVFVIVSSGDQRGQRIEMPSTESEGWYAATVLNRQRIHCLVETPRGDRLITQNSFAVRRDRRNTETQTRSIIMTDRGIYRPGQTVHFKVIAHSIGHGEDPAYETLRGKAIEVVIRDANGQEFQRMSRTTNAFGSAWGTFALPKETLTGRFSIAVEQDVRGSTTFSVEAYKRPKFEVEVEDVDSGRLNEPITVGGTATGYTGLPVSGADVRYTVLRQSTYPRWCWWSRPQPSEQVAEGSTLTGDDGRFKVEFDAKPASGADPSTGVTFTYQIDVDVTDGTGETQSASHSVQLGFSELQASIDLKSTYQVGRPMKASVAVRTLGGVGRAVTGTLRVHEVLQPEEPRVQSIGYPTTENPFAEAEDGTNSNAGDLESSDPQRWPTRDAAVKQLSFATDADGTATVRFPLAVGLYRLQVDVDAEDETPVRAMATISVIDPAAKDYPIAVPSDLLVDPNPVEVGEDATVIWGSGWRDARAFIEMEYLGHRKIQTWTPEGESQTRISIPITEAMRGGITVRTTLIHDNQCFQQVRRIEVPWSNKRLNIEVQRWRDLIRPGESEVIELQVSGPDAESAIAELVATMYDASLDQYAPLSWPNLNVFRRETSYLPGVFASTRMSGRVSIDRFPTGPPRVNVRHPFIDDRLFPPARGRGGFGMPMAMMMRGGMVESAMAEDLPAASDPFFAGTNVDFAVGDEMGGGGEAFGFGKRSDGPPEIPARTNLAETTFFRPAVEAGENGVYTIRFTVGDALTTWRFLGFAHDTELRHGMIEREAVTRKELMIEPNPPRFVRTSDRVVWTAKVTNASDTDMDVVAAAKFFGLDESDDLNDRLKLSDAEQAFRLSAGQSRTVRWATEVPDDIRTLTHRFTVRSDQHADGEENFLAVLPRRTLVRESMAINLRGGRQRYTFDALAKSADSDTLDHQRLEWEAVPDPQWIVLGSLPYLVEFPHECAEQTFNRLYANVLGRHVVQSDPKMARVIRRWQSEGGNQSGLNQTPERRELTLGQTPWSDDAAAQDQSLDRLTMFLDDNAVTAGIASAQKRLRELQNGDGSLSWFPGGPPNLYMTMYVASGYGRLRSLGDADVGFDLPIAAWRYVDAEMDRRMQKIRIDDRDRDHFDAMVAMYLDGRSRFLDLVPIDEQHAASWQYWIDQTETHLLPDASWMTRAKAALAMNRLGRPKTVELVLRSLRENAISTDDGVTWKMRESPYWYDSPIETLAAIAELFRELSDDEDMVSDIHRQMIRNRRTHHWPSTRSTAEAVATIFDPDTRMTDLSGVLKVQIGAETLDPPPGETATGIWTRVWHDDAIDPSMGTISVVAPEDAKTAAWASLHWSYLEDLSKVRSVDGSDLRVEKETFVKSSTDEGARLSPINRDGESTIRVGDRLVTRLTIHCDREMQFVHLRDHRAAGTEPVDVLSGYRWQDGLGYYQATGDAATHFFIDTLPKGVYVLQYETFATLEGVYQSGYANLQCMYAPEYAAHSESIEVEIGGGPTGDADGASSR